ncbi:MAG: hypothetical protein FWC77_07260, partial [Defluviitaleaceae bacterium]|nr:hypothetical protein [Defluviitaleaceae bacterium]
MKKNYIPGDVLIFKAGKEIEKKNYMGRAIARLTDSDVSHAALAINNEEMVEMGPHGIKISSIPSQNLYQLRHTAKLDMTKVVNIANGYVKDSVHYDYPSLV